MSQAPSAAPEHPVLAGVRAANDELDKATCTELWQAHDDEVESALGAVLAAESRLAGLRGALLREAETRGMRARTSAFTTAGWLNDRFRISRSRADRVTGLATALGRHPQVEVALAGGALDEERAGIAVQVLDRAAELPAATEPDLEAAAELLVEHAGMLDPTRLRRAGEQLLEALASLAPSVDDPADAAAVEREREAAEKAAQEAERNRVWFTRRPGGRSRSRLDLGPLGTAVLYAWAEAHADPSRPGADGFEDRRPLPERRGDALVELLGRALRAGAADEPDEFDLPPTGTDGPSAIPLTGDADQVQTPALDGGPELRDDAGGDARNAAARADAECSDTELADAECRGAELAGAEGRDEGERRRRSGGGVRRMRKRSWVRVAVTIGLADLQAGLAGAGVLDTGGTLSAAEARRLACEAGIIPMLLAGPDQPLNVGRVTRTWNLYQQRYIYARDRGCVAPGCDRVPADCQIHHRRAWADGGLTDVDNGVLLCLFHHQQVHRQGWKVVMAANGYPQLIPPASIDAEQRPRQHHRYRLTLLTGRHRT